MSIQYCTKNDDPETSTNLMCVPTFISTVTCVYVVHTLCLVLSMMIYSINGNN